MTWPLPTLCSLLFVKLIVLNNSQTNSDVRHLLLVLQLKYLTQQSHKYLKVKKWQTTPPHLSLGEIL